MYSLNEYGHMLADTNRVRAYLSALKQVVHPGAVVVEIGTGVGFFALMVARLGASRVYAFESSPAIVLADRFVQANGGGPIQLIRARSTQVQLTEQADVVFSDLRGTLPVFADHFSCIVDARERLLKPGGALIPQRDRLWVALVSSDPLYRRTHGVWQSIRADANMSPVYEAQACTPVKARVTEAELLSDERWWQTLDYEQVQMASLSNNVTLVAKRDAICHGCVMWFDTDLWADVGFTNHPAKPQTIYGQMFFPWRQPLTLRADDVVECLFAADVVNDVYVWRWEVTARLGTFRQSTENLPDIIDAVNRQTVAGAW